MRKKRVPIVGALRCAWCGRNLNAVLAPGRTVIVPPLVHVACIARMNAAEAKLARVKRGVS